MEKSVFLAKVKEMMGDTGDRYPEEPAEWELIQEGEWEQDHKYQLRTNIYKYEGQLFAMHCSRSGSYHSDWYYDGVDFDLVEAKEVTKIVYVSI